MKAEKSLKALVQCLERRLHLPGVIMYPLDIRFAGYPHPSGNDGLGVRISDQEIQWHMPSA